MRNQTSIREEKSEEEKLKGCFRQERLPVLGSTVMGSTTGGSLALSLARDSPLARDSSLAEDRFLAGERSLAGESALGGIVEADDESDVITTPS